MTLREALSNWKPVLMDLPTVVGVGEGKRGDTDVLCIYVSGERSPSSPANGGQFPREVEGYATEVIDVGEICAGT